MTAPKTTRTRRPRTRKPQPSQALVLRDPWPGDLAADFLILSSRLAVTRPPVFWAEGELAARTTWVDGGDDDYEDNYRRVMGDDPEWDWNWYRASQPVAELERIPAAPVAVLTVVPPLGELSEANERRFRAVFSDPDDAGAQWRFAIDVPGPEEDAALPPAAPRADLGGAPGPGTQDQS